MSMVWPRCDYGNRAELADSADEFVFNAKRIEYDAAGSNIQSIATTIMEI
jgi:hypothetical protein